MDRRSFLTATGPGLGAAAAAGLAAPALAQGGRVLTMVTSWSRSSAGLHAVAERIAASIHDLSDGALSVDLKAAGELVGAFDVFDAVTSGQVDMYHGPDYWFIGQHPAFAFFSAVPFGMTAQELAVWYYQDGGAALHGKLGEAFGLAPYLAGTTGPQSGGWFRAAVRAPEDLSGMRLRVAGLGGAVLSRLGAEVMAIPTAAEVRAALARGELDGAEWAGPWADAAIGFAEVAPCHYPAGFHEPGVGLTLAVNRRIHAALSGTEQRILAHAAAEAYQWSMTLFAAKNAEALERLRAAGVQSYEFPAAVWEALAGATVEVHGGHLGDSLYAETYQSMLRSVRRTSGWLSASEATFRRQRDRVYG